MEILSICFDEIALSGREGCTLQELWYNLSSRQPCIPFKLDEFTRPFIWSRLLQQSADGKGNLIFYLLPQARELAESERVQVTGMIGDVELLEYFHPHPYRLVSTGADGQRGSCSTHDTRKNITQELLQEQPTLDEAEAKYGHTLVLVGGQELRERALFPKERAPYFDISDVQYCLLELVGCARHYGILRTAVTNRYLKIDARSTFHHVKTLAEAGLITVKSCCGVRSGGHSQLMHMLFLSRYSPCWESDQSTERKFCTLLERAPGHTLPVTKLTEYLGGQPYKSARHALLQKGIIELVNMGEVFPDEDLSPDVARSKGYRLVQPFPDENKQLSTVTGDKEVEDEEEVEEDDEEDIDTGARVPVVVELPLDVQGYMLIDRTGPHGIANQNFCSRGLAIDERLARKISKHLIKASDVVTITMDDVPVRRIKLVSARHLKKNKEYENLHAEKMKSRVANVELAIRTGSQFFQSDSTPRVKKVKPETSGALNSSEDFHGLVGKLVEQGSGEDDYSSLLAVEEQRDNGNRGSLSEPGSVLAGSQSSMSSLEPHPSSRKSFMTYHQLKRCNLITEYLERVRIMQGTMDVSRYVREAEIKEGRVCTIDKKTVHKLLKRLEADGRLILTEIEVVTGQQTHKVALYHLPDVSAEELTAAKNKAQSFFEGIAQRRELKGKVKKENREVEVEVESSDGSDVTEGQIDVPVRAASKFQRLRHLHYYLWILAYGMDGEAASGEDGATDDESKKRSIPLFLPPANFPWVEATHRLPQSSKGPGWISFNDMLQYMPLSLYTHLMKLYSGPLSSKYLHYFEDPVHKNDLFCELPKKLRKHLTHGRRDVIQVNHQLERLSEMDLVTMDGSFQFSREKTSLFIHLNHNVSILDTSTAKPRRSFFLNEARHLFQEQHYSFDKLADLEKYWFQLQTISLQTPIILIDRRQVSKKRQKKLKGREDVEGECESELYAKDTHPLPYTVSGKKSSEDYKRFNTMGFGAGGLPPLAFSHLSRNWSQYTPGATGEEVTGEEAGSSLHRLKLGSIPWVKMDTGYEEEAGEGSTQGDSNTGLLENLEDTLQPPVKKPRTITVPSTQIQKHSGGKGKERHRTKTARKTKKSDGKSVSSKPPFSLVIAVSPSEEDEDSAINKKKRERVSWYMHEDSFLFMAYIASLALHKKGAPAVTYSQIRDSLHREYETSRDKPAASIRRRLHFILRKRKYLLATVDICVTEVLQELEVMKESAVALDYDGMLEHVLTKYKSMKSHFLNQSDILPATLSEFYNTYEVLGTECPIPKAQLETRQDVNRALVTDLIIASLGAEESSYDQYATFKLFESFPESDVKAAFEGLKNLFLIRPKRTVFGIPRHRGPLETQSYELSTTFFSKLEQQYPTDLFEEIEDFTQELEDHSNSADHMSMKDEHADCERTRSLSNMESSVVRVETESAQGGSVAAVVGMLFGECNERRMRTLGTNQVFSQPVFPDTLLEPKEEPMETDGEIFKSQPDVDDGEEPEDAEDKEDNECEERMDNQDATANESSAQLHSGRFTGYGINTLLQVNEGSALRAGYLDLELGVNCGQLMDPLPTETSSTEDTTVLPVSMSGATIDQYLHICLHHLKFQQPDIDFARALYEVIDSSGETGISVSEIMEHCSLRDLQPELDVALHIQHLINLEMAYQVGFQSTVLVTRSHCERWFMPVKSTVGGVPFHPWTTVNSEDPNPSLLSQYQHGVLMYVMAHPGVTLPKLAENFFGMIQMSGLQEILQFLEISGLIRKCKVPSHSCRAFSGFDKNSTVGDAIICYEAKTVLRKTF